MIEELLKRPPVREFLNKYPSERWKKLITDVFEIGVLNLYNSFHTFEFSEREFNAILNDLRYYNGRSAPTPYSNPTPINYYPPKPIITQSNYYERNNEPRIFNHPKKCKKYSTARGEVFVTNEDEIIRKFGNKNHTFDRYAGYRIMENKHDYNLKERIRLIPPSDSVASGIQQSKIEYANKMRQKQEEDARLQELQSGEEGEEGEEDEKEDGGDQQGQVEGEIEEEGEQREDDEEEEEREGD